MNIVIAADVMVASTHSCQHTHINPDCNLVYYTETSQLITHTHIATLNWPSVTIIWFGRNCGRYGMRHCRREGCIMSTFALSYCTNWTCNNIWSSQWIKNYRQSGVTKNVACLTLLCISVYSVIWIDHCVWCVVAILQELFQHLMCDGMNPFMYYHAVILYVLHICHTVTDRQLWLLIYCIVYGNYFIWKQVFGTSCQFVDHSPLCQVPTFKVAQQQEVKNGRCQIK